MVLLQAEARQPMRWLLLACGMKAGMENAFV